MKYKPQLFSNELPTYDDITYPVIASYKLDGIRCIFKDGEMLSRSLKQIPNKQLQERFQFLKDYSRVNNVILDGELYDHNMTFQEITHYVMTEDFESERSVKKHGEVKIIPDTLKFHCFDKLYQEVLDEEYLNRMEFPNMIVNKYLNICNTKWIDNKKQLKDLYELAIKEGYEGLIVRKPESKYKMGRVTFKSGDGYKFKPYETFDAKIIGVTQAEELINKKEDMVSRLCKDGVFETYHQPDLTDEEVKNIYEGRYGALRTTNELGRTVTSKKKEDRIPIEQASSFIVLYEGKQVEPVIAMTDMEKMMIWKNKEDYIGKMIEYKGMLVGSKDVPRHPVMLRFRDDKE